MKLKKAIGFLTLLSLLQTPILTLASDTPDERVVPKLQNNTATPAEAQDEATVKAAQYISLNDMVKSYIRFPEETALSQSALINEIESQTIRDWRLWNSSPYKDIKSVTASNRLSSNNSLNNSKLAADIEMTRALNVLGEKAFIPENVDSKAMSSYIHEITYDKLIGKTEALVTLYKAIGKEHYLPPVIAFRNLDDTTLEGRYHIKDTTLNSLPEAEPYLFYAVDVDDARKLVYLSNNLVEGYLWDAIQDGVIQLEDLTDEAFYSIKNKYLKGVYSTVLTPDNLTTNEMSIMSDTPSAMLGHSIILKGNKDIGVRYRDPKALKDESVTLLDFLTLARKIMYANGDEILIPSEMKMLTKVLGQQIPSNISDENYETILYLTSRGIISESNFDDLYEPLNWGDALTIASRIADKNSRLTYKYIEVEYDKSLEDDGYIPVPISTGEADISNVKADTSIRQEIYLEAIFKTETGKFIFPSISQTVGESLLKEIGFVEKQIYYSDDGKPYYRLVIPSTESISEEILKKTELVGQVPEQDLAFKLPNFLTMGRKVELKWDENAQKYILENANKNFHSSKKVLDVVPYSSTTQQSSVGEYTKVEFTTSVKPGEGFIMRGVNTYELVTSDQVIGLPIKIKDTNDTNLSKLFYTEIKEEDKVIGYKCYVYMPINDKSEYHAALLQRMTFKEITQSGMIGYVRRLDNSDTYISLDAVQSILGIEAAVTATGTTLTKEGLSIEIVNIDGGYNIINSDGVLMHFSDKIPPIKDVNGKYTIHSSILNYILERTGDNTLSLNISKGKLYLGNSQSYSLANTDNGEKNTSWLMTASESKIIKPLLGNTFLEVPNLVFKRNGKESYLNLNAVPPEMRPYIIEWRYEDVNTIKSSVYLVSPTGGTADKESTWNKLLSYGIDVPKRVQKSFSISKYNPKLYKEVDATKLGYSNPTTIEVMDNSIVTNRLIYDPVTNSILYELPSASNVKTLEDMTLLKNDKVTTAKLPFFIEDSGAVIFSNIPMANNTVYKNDIAGYEFGTNNLITVLNSIASDGSAGKNVSWYPTALLANFNPPEKLEDTIQYRIWAGPYYRELKKVVYENNKADSINNKYTTKGKELPDFAQSIYGSKSKDYILTNDNLKNVNVLNNTLTSREYLFSSTSSSNLESEEIQNKINNNTIIELKNKIDLNYIFNHIFNFTSFADLTITNILPRFAFMLLLLTQALAVFAKHAWMIRFCDNVFDVYRLITFGLVRREDIEPFKLIMMAFAGQVVLVLISRRELHNILEYIISNL